MNVFLKSIKLFLIRSQEYWNLIWARAKWRSQNKHNLTVPGRLFPFKKVKVGKGTYGTLNVISYGNIEENLSIGNYCSIAGNVVFILSGEHSYDHLSTYPFQKIYGNGNVESISKGPIVIDDDVWIGYGCTILSGVKIGRGAVIGAGSIVSKSIPPYTIFAGGKIIKKRFPDDIIEKLMKIDYTNIDEIFIKNNLSLFEKKISSETIDEIVALIDSNNKHDRFM